MKPLFMLDTDSVSFALRGQGGVAARILERRPSEICISALTLAELRYGAARRKSKKLHELIDVFISNIEVVPFDDICAAQFGVIASGLADRGSPIGEFDALIAAHALALELTLVTNKRQAFRACRGIERRELGLTSFSTWKVDFMIKQRNEFDRSRFERRRIVEIAGIPLYTATAEDILITKLWWAMLGESERQVRDAAGIIEVQGIALDSNYVQEWVGKLELEEQWAAARRLAG